MRSQNLQDWTKDELIKTIEVLRRENRSLQVEISKFLTGTGRTVPPLSSAGARPGINPRRPRVDLTKRCRA